MGDAPIFVDSFLSPVRDNTAAQVAIAAMLLLTLADVLFGLANALMHKSFSSSRMREGIGHKCASFGLVFVADVVDGTIVGGLDLGFSAPVLVVACGYLIIMEVASLLETFRAMNPDLSGSPVLMLLEGANARDDKEADHE